MPGAVSAVGFNGTVILLGDEVSILRGGGKAQGPLRGVGDLIIPLKEIGTIQFQKPKVLTAGFIRLAPTGCSPLDRYLAAMSDPNTVTFHGPEVIAFEKLRNAIHDAMRAGRQNLQPVQ